MNAQKKLILASTSPYRKQLLEQLNVSFTQTAPDVDESAIQQSSLTPKQKAETLAILKAEAVLNSLGDAQDVEIWVLGGDQIAAVDDTILNKAGTVPKAVEQLLFLAGKTHVLYTAIALISVKKRYIFTHETTLSMKSLNREQIQGYVEVDMPLDCAGSYKFECAGHRLFNEVVTDDETAIQGLPQKQLGQWLRAEDFLN